MRETTKICAHCGMKYGYFLSGMPYHNHLLNDDKYCPDCKQVILDALSKVPVKFAEVSIDASTEVTREELLKLHEKENANIAKMQKEHPNAIYGYRCFPEMIAPGGDHTMTISVKHPNGFEYYLMEWKIDHEYEISRRIRWNLVDDVPEDKGSYSREIKIQYNSDKKERPIKKWPENAFKMVPMTEPLSLTYAMRFSEELNDFYNFGVTEESNSKPQILTVSQVTK